MNMNIKTLTLSIMKAIVNALPFAILLSTIMSIGAICQRILTQFLASEEANLYDTMNKGLICVRKTDFVTWFMSYMTFWYLIPSIIIVIYVTRKARTAKKILGYMYLFIFSTLTLVDIVFDNFDHLLVNVVSNLFGTLIIIAILILSLDMGKIINDFFDINSFFNRKIIDALTLILISFLIAFIVYSVEKNIYYVTTSKIDLTMKLPIYGSFKAEKKLNHNFGPFASTDLNFQKKEGNFVFTGFSEDFSLDWKKNVNDKAYKAEIRVLDECYEEDAKTIKKVLSNPPTYTIENINKISLDVNNGTYEMSLFPISSSKSGVISLVDKKEVNFNIEKSKKKGYELTRVIDPSTELNHNSWIDKTSYVLFFPNFGVTDSKVELINRNVHLNTGIQDINITLMAKTVDLDKKMKCKTLQKSKNDNYHLNSVFGGMILTIQEFNNSQTSVLYSTSDEEKTQMRGIRGWMIVDEVSKNDLSKYIQNGNLHSFNVIAPIKEIYIDEQEKKVGQSSNHVVAHDGNLTGEITEDNLIRFTGTSKAIYLNKKRANLSRWEKVDIAYKLALIPILGVIITFLANRVRLIVTENRQYW